MRRAGTESRLLLSCCAQAAFACFGVGCSPSSSYHLNSTPSDKVVVVGTVPNGVNVELTASYWTTVFNDACAPRMRWPVGTRFARKSTFPVGLANRAGNQMTWIVWRDLLLSGSCGWQFASIEVKADRVGEFAAHVKTNLPNTIAGSAACLRSTDIDFPYCPSTTRVNADDSIPVHMYCKFSLLGRNGGSSFNPCAFDNDGKIGVGPGEKSIQLLQPGQHEVRFLLADLENSG